MAISRVSAGHTNSATVTFGGTYSAGDYIVVGMVNASTSAVPTVPSGWTLIANVSDSTDGCAYSLFGKFAASSSESAITVSNATAGSYAIYHGINATTPFSNAGGQSGNSSTMSFSGIGTMTQAGGAGTSWVLCGAASNSSSGSLSLSPPTGKTYIGTTDTASTWESCLYDTNGPVSSSSFNNQTIGASEPWLTKTVELNAAAAGGGGTPTNLFFYA